MGNILDLSAAMIDSGELLEPPMRITNELSEISDGVALVESFSNVVVLRTGDGLALFDASGTATGSSVARSLRGWSTERVNTLVYTHGHLDHVGGSGAFAADGRERGHEPRPRRRAHQRGRPVRSISPDRRMERAHQPATVRWRAAPVRVGNRRRRRVPAIGRAGVYRDLRSTAAPSTSAASRSSCTMHGARPTTTPGRGFPSTAPSRPATSSRGSSRTPATRRRCSATRSNGRRRYGR